MNNVQKFVDLANQLISEIKKTTGINKAGINQATRHIGYGAYIKPNSWERPTAEEENKYILEKGMDEFSKWFLGVDDSIDSKSKGHWTYIYTSDFKNVDRAGLVAIRQRAGQNKETVIFEAAGKLLEKIDA